MIEPIKTEQDFKDTLVKLGLEDTTASYDSDDDNYYYEKHPVSILFRKKSKLDKAEFDGTINIFTNPRFEMNTSRHMDTSLLSFQNVYELIVHQMKLNKVGNLTIQLEK